MAVVIVAVTAMGYLLYYGGQTKGRADYLAIESRLKLSAGMNEHLQDEVAQLRQALDARERSAAIDAHAYAQIKRTVTQQQVEIFDIREELAFYRGVAVNKVLARPLRIHNLRILRAGAAASGFLYKLAFSRVPAAQDASKIRGQVKMTVDGVLGTASASVEWDELSAGGLPLDFEFRHYGRLQGTIRLPEGLEPIRVIVHVRAEEEDGPALRIERVFDWPVPQS
ncbi:MAG: hypothetical protein GKR94_03610 [Gammaproteobacteria bacterium]|nr:hypothetical protein [Gammaproteobacteria bacterium]